MSDIPGWPGSREQVVVTLGVVVFSHQRLPKDAAERKGEYLRVPLSQRIMPCGTLVDVDPLGEVILGLSYPVYLAYIFLFVYMCIYTHTYIYIYP